jgi:Family of unknown function (DUF6174)
MTMRSLLILASLAFALTVVPIAASQVTGPQRTVDPGIANGSKQRALSTARKAWKSRGVSSYTYRLSVNCFCPPTTSVKLVVRNGFPAKSTPRNLRDQATVPRLFRTIQQAIDAKAAKLEVTYGTRGVPRAIYIDRDERIADEEIGYIVRGFAPLKR